MSGDLTSNPFAKRTSMVEVTGGGKLERGPMDLEDQLAAAIEAAGADAERWRQSGGAE